MNKFDLRGQCALVTGASSGLGAHFAKVLSAEGAEVFLAARRINRLQTLADEIRTAGSVAHVVQMDVTDRESVTQAFDAIEAQGKPAGIIVNNSGLSREDWIADMTEDAWDLVMETNLKGAWRVARTAAQRLIAAKAGGSIINTASITAFRVSHMLGAYATSKAAINHLTKAMALEWARAGIRVNAIAPGYFLTEINDHFLDTAAAEKMIKRIPMKRLGNLEELSGPLLLLASDAGAYMTGTTLVVDGGHLQAAL